ncbi:MAG: T9SS type A sorting domain-containing protein, partial [Flavobacteriales bacterium]|nr:T9SS type A sorting domain-containing protein [Flavobacteriales bacterium]
ACAAVTDTMVITIGAGAVVDAGPDQTACGTGCVTLAGVVSGATTTGQWSTGGSGAFTPDNVTLTACYTPSSADTAAGSVLIMLTSTNNGTCLAVEDTMMITFGVGATANAGPDATACEGSPFALAGSIGGIASSSTWTTSGDGIFDDPSMLAATYTPGTADATAGTVTLTLTTDDPAGPCVAGTDDMVITVSPVPVAAFISNITNLTALFIDNSTISSGTIQTFDWDFGDGQTSSSQGPTNVYAADSTYNVCLSVTSDMGCIGSTCNVISVTSVGISEIDLDEFVEVFPNPSADGMLNVRLDGEQFNGSTLRVTNLYGQLITERKIEQQGLQILDLSNNDAGVYMIQVTTDHGTITKRITIF